MRHDTEREPTHALLDSSAVPERWAPVLTHLRASPFTRLSREDILAEATGLLIVAPTAEVVDASLTGVLNALTPVPSGFVTVLPVEAVVPAGVPAGTWILLPHRADGWVELEAASAQLHRAIVAENAARNRDERVTLLEYGVNLWLWAEPPSTGGDPVCHTGELISWESAWTLSGTEAAPREESSARRPPILFGLPSTLRLRRAQG